MINVSKNQIFNRSITVHLLLAMYLKLCENMEFISWASQSHPTIHFPKLEYCERLTKEIWMTEKKYVEDLIAVCQLKQKFEEYHTDGYSTRIMFGSDETSVEKILLLHR